MSDEQGRPDSQKSRQELLDEIYYLRDVAGEREQRAQRAEAQLAEMRTKLDLVLHSRSWRSTAPLRWIIRFGRRILGGSSASVPTADAILSHGKAAVATAGVSKANTTGVRPSLSDRRDGTPRLFVDITELALRDGKTGVQRVTREILRALLVSPPDGYVVEPVIAEPGQPYRVAAARRFQEEGLWSSGSRGTRPPRTYADENGSRSAIRSLAPMDALAGDVFLGLDHAIHAVVEHADELAAMRQRGVRLWFVCNDVLPLAHPEWFPPEVHDAFKSWFETITRVADGVACISRATETDVRHWLDVLQIQRELPLSLGRFHLGSDIDSGAPPANIAQEEQAMIDRLRRLPSFLMVGTLEPRKGHAQALEAFNQLWANEQDVALVIAGFPGWMTEVTQRRIRHHDEFGTRLFWFMDASDALLETLYASCTALLAPSEGEGFGLPLVEAARHDLPILCRDLPVFREVAGQLATYFSGIDAESLAGAIGRWLQDPSHGRLVSTARMSWLSWAESAYQLMYAVLGSCKDVPQTHDE